MLSKERLINIGIKFTWDETFSEDLSLNETLEMMLTAISLIKKLGPRSEDSRRLMCCLSACAHHILNRYSIIADQNKGINWKKLAVFKRDIMFERVTSPHRYGPGKMAPSMIDRVCFPLVSRALEDIVRVDITELETALVHIRDDRAFRQSQSICTNITKVMDYCYDELLLRSTTETIVKMLQDQPLTNQNVAVFLYKLLCIGEALNQISLYSLSHFTSEIAHMLIHIRNFLCHSERPFNRLVITRLLQGELDNPLIDLKKISLHLPHILKTCAKLLDVYKKDAINVKSIDDPHIPDIWKRILSYTYVTPTPLENETDNALYTCNISTMYNFLEKYEQDYAALRYAVDNDIPYDYPGAHRILESYPCVELRFQAIVRFYALTAEQILGSNEALRHNHENIDHVRDQQTNKINKMTRVLDKYETQFLAAQYRLNFFSNYQPEPDNWELYEANIEEDYPTLQNKHYALLKIQDDGSKLKLRLMKKQCLELLEPMLNYFFYILQHQDESSKIYLILAGSQARALLEGDRYTRTPPNHVFISYVREIYIDLNPLITVSLFEGLKDLIQGMRGYLAHLKQAEVGERKFHDLKRWPYRDSNLSIDFIRISYDHFVRLKDSYAAAVARIEQDVEQFCSR